MTTQVCPTCGSENPAQFKLCGFCGTTLAATEETALRTPEERKTVTMVFTDLVGSTSLGERVDPETMASLLNRYFAVMTAILKRHGGSIEKFIGDAIVAVFGIPQVHEDDALRAVRAAHEMQLALARLNEELERTFGTPIEARIGVNTGEIVVGESVTGQQVVTGDTANTAARLEQAAPSMGVYIGGSTYRLVRDAVEVEVMPPLELKGKAEPVPAYRLLGVRGTDEGVARRIDTPLVGRTVELEALQAAYRRAVDGQRCHAVTLIGDAGVGKSRLIREFITRVGDEPRVVRGRALSYGEGITFWPLAELVRDAAAIDIDAPAQAALDKLHAVVGDPEVVTRLASAIGLTDEPLPVSELTWGARRFFEILAADRPVVAIVDDIHWAEPTFLDLLEHLTDHLEGARVLILATARHDLLDARPEWGHTVCTSLVTLEGLSSEEAGSVVANLLGEAGLPAALQQRIVRASGGNPLFVEQMLSMLIDEGRIQRTNGSWHLIGDLGDFAVPPTIQALLAARLDRLDREEHAVLDPAAVIGVEFPTPAVTDLSPAVIQHQVGSLLESMTAKQLMRPTGSVIVGYRFGHQLVRDTAYQSMLKRSRSQLHERYADWLTLHEADRVGEVEEVIGYHLEQAYRYLLGLGPVDDHGRTLGERAAELLVLSGRRAFAREDMHAAVGLLRRAVELQPVDSTDRHATQLLLAEALDETGDYGAATEVLDEIESGAGGRGDERSAASARLLRLRVELSTAPGTDWATRALAEADRLAPRFEELGDLPGTTLAWRVRYVVHATTGQLGAAADDAERIIALATEAGDERQRLRGISNLAIALTYGPTPAAEAADRLAALRTEVGRDRMTSIVVTAALGQLMAMRNEREVARARYAEAQEAAAELGQPVFAAQLALDGAEILLRAGDPAAAQAVLEDAARVFESVGDTYYLASVAGMLGRAELEQGQLAAASASAERASTLAASDDVDAQARWRGLQSAILVMQGRPDDAVRLAQEAVDLSEQGDLPLIAALALGDLAVALNAAGQTGPAAEARDRALALYDAKGDLASADRLRRRLASESASPSP